MKYSIISILIILAAGGGIVFTRNLLENPPAPEPVSSASDSNETPPVSALNERDEQRKVASGVITSGNEEVVSGQARPREEQKADTSAEARTNSTGSDEATTPQADPQPQNAPNPTGVTQQNQAPAPSSTSSNSPAPQSSTYICENDLSVSSRAYVLLLGFDDNNVAGAQSWLEGQIANDPKNRGVLVYAHNADNSLASIGDEFVSRFNTFIAEAQPQETIVIGWSAGGTIAASQAHRLKVPGTLEIHTVASPLKGYSLSGFLEFIIEGEVGLGREIGLGFAPFPAPPANAKAYHHKTVTDSDLSGRCGDFASFCDPRAIQANNLTGAKEFFYPQYDHEPIMHAVAEAVVACRK